MLYREPEEKQIEQWKQCWAEWHDRLQPARRCGSTLAAWLMNHYPVTPLRSLKAKWVVRRSVTGSSYYRKKLPAGRKPRVLCWVIEPYEAGAALYRDRPEEMAASPAVWVGIDLAGGYFHVEGSDLLWDQLCALQGVDEDDLGNFFLTAQYVEACRRCGVPLMLREDATDEEPSKEE